MSPDLSGSTVLLTGASGRLGRVLARHLLEAGAVVVGVDASRDEAAQGGQRFHLYAADLTDEQQVERVFAEAASTHGPIHALIHTVGMWDGRPLAETSLEDWDNVLRVNLTSAFLCFREAVRHFLRHGDGGRLVAVASKQGADGGVAEQAAYSASKAGVIRLVEATAREHGEQGVSAAAVAPSMILFGDGEEGDQGVAVERVAALCAYLASSDGDVHNGAVLRAYGSMM